MKSSPLFILIISIIVSMMGSACNSGNNHPDPDTQPARDTLGNNKAFESEAKVLESADRVIWQKPDLVIDQLGNVTGKVVADLGAGTGYFSRRIAYKGAKVIAIDIDPQAIQWMKEQRAKFPIELQEKLIIRQAEPNDPKLYSNEVDMVLLVNTYSYISNRVDYFSRLKNAIRPGGNIIIIDFKKKETPFGPPIEERIDIGEVIRELNEAGYAILKTDQESLEYQYIIKAREK